MVMTRKIDTSFLKSKIARRIFFLFISCALLPIAILSYICFKTISYEFNQRARKELRQICKTNGLDIYNNLLILELKINLIASEAETQKDIVLSDSQQNLQDYFEDITLYKEHKTIPLLAGGVYLFPRLTEDEINYLNSEKVLIFIQDAKIFMIKKIKSGMIVAEIKKEYLWAKEAPFHVVGAHNVFLSKNSLPFTISGDDRIFSNQFEYADQGETYIASFWPIFLRNRFLTPDWIVITSRSQSDILLPLRTLRNMVILISLLSFLIVTLLSIIQIRKSLIPIEILKQGTQRIAAGNLKSKITLHSGDEFEELGESFNKMSQEIDSMQGILVQTEKMKAIGQMSSAIVHEINQPLTAIKGYLDLVLNHDSLSETAKKHLETVNKSVDRLAEIAGKFKRFSRNSAKEPLTKISLNDSLSSLHELLKHQLVKKNVEFILDLAKGLPPILGNDNSLQQAFMNLVVNAVDAIEEENAGSEHSKNPLIKITTYSNNNHVIAAVEDNGPGISMEIRKKIFEPFFTTKSAEKGTGLGLAVIKSILNDHGGGIECTSELGRGTTFTLTFPVAQ